jgi:3-hydroxyisobutyrate dehydrogenase
MLPSSEHVKEAYLGPQGVLSLEPRTLHPHLLIDASTIDPLTAREVAAAASDIYLHPHAAEAHDGQQSPMMIDAPVSGGVPGAQAGSLTFMCGGPAAAVDAARPLLEVMGKRIIYCEPMATWLHLLSIICHAGRQPLLLSADGAAVARVGL